MTAPEPGWYADPSGQPQLRYWDGTRWTRQTKAPGARSPQPMQSTPTVAPPQAPAAGGWISVEDTSVLEPPAPIEQTGTPPSSAAPSWSSADNLAPTDTASPVPRWVQSGNQRRSEAARQAAEAEARAALEPQPGPVDDAPTRPPRTRERREPREPRTPREPRSPRPSIGELAGKVRERAADAASRLPLPDTKGVDINNVIRIAVTAAVCFIVIVTGWVAGRPGPAPLSVLPLSFAESTGVPWYQEDLDCVGEHLADIGVVDDTWEGVSAPTKRDVWAAAQACLPDDRFNDQILETFPVPMAAYESKCVAKRIFTGSDPAVLATIAPTSAGWRTTAMAGAIDAAFDHCGLDPARDASAAAHQDGLDADTVACVAAAAAEHGLAAVVVAGGAAAYASSNCDTSAPLGP